MIGHNPNKTSCKGKWLTTNQDEYRDPSCVKVYRNIQSEELARYEDCMKESKGVDDDERLKEIRTILCCTEQNENREPVIFPTDSHLAASSKPKWCRCLATGNPNNYEEIQEELQTDDNCYCKMVYNQMEETSMTPTNRSNYFVDFRDPAYGYIADKIRTKEVLDARQREYKEMADKKDEIKEAKGFPSPSHPNYEELKETLHCRKALRTNLWTTTYREMNKEGGSLPITQHPLPKSCIERPPGDPLKKSDMAPKAICDLGEVFEKWDRPQVRLMANRCDLMSVNPCLSKDSYFQEQRFCRTKFARCKEYHANPKPENLKLARENRLRLPYDRMIPGYAGYDMMEAPPVCKIQRNINRLDPDEPISTYQAQFGPFPVEMYENPVLPYTPRNLDRMGIATNPIFTLSKMPLPPVNRLICCQNPCANPPAYC